MLNVSHMYKQVNICTYFHKCECMLLFPRDQMTPLDLKQAAAALSCCNEFTMTITWELMKTRIGVSNFDIDIDIHKL